MKESAANFEARTGKAWRPIAQGTPPGPRESVPTLYRYPGPQGMAEMLQGRLDRLAPPDAPFVWLAESAKADNAKTVGLFGVLAVLQPLRLGVTRDGKHWLGENRPVADSDALVWLPPVAVKAGLNLDRVAEPEPAMRKVKDYAGEKSRVTDLLGAYLEELGALQNAGANPPDRPWCALPAATRKKLLASHGLRGRFTR